MENRLRKSLCIFDQSHPLEVIHEKNNYQHLLFWAFGERNTLYSVNEHSKNSPCRISRCQESFQGNRLLLIERVILFMDDEVAACYWSKQLKTAVSGVPILLVVREPCMSDRVFHECGIRTVVRSRHREPLFIIREHLNKE